MGLAIITVVELAQVADGEVDVWFGATCYPEKTSQQGSVGKVRVTVVQLVQVKFGQHRSGGGGLDVVQMVGVLHDSSIARCWLKKFSFSP
eukprot:1994108-Pyramimonas_sp.AAC.1